MTKPVTLLDGSPARAWSPEECRELEALALLAMPTVKQRREHLAAVERYSGKMERRRLEETALRLWDARSLKTAS